MCGAVEKIVKEENARVEERATERVMVSAVQHVVKSFNVSEEDAAEKLGYDLSSYEKAKLPV